MCPHALFLQAQSHIQVIFVPKYVFRVVFEGGILGSARNFWGNPYLNSTTVLFDKTTTFWCNHMGQF